LIDPRSGEYIGTTLVDFSITEIYRDLNNPRASTYAIVSPGAPDDVNVVTSSAGAERTDEALYDLLFPYESFNSSNREAFDFYHDSMARGELGSGFFDRTGKNESHETIVFAYHPVNIRELAPTRPDDFSRGANASKVLLYSFVMATKKDDLYAKFYSISDEITETMTRTARIYLTLTSFITLLCIFATATVSYNVWC
jgi:hypothetical protein